MANLDLHVLRRSYERHGRRVGVVVPQPNADGYVVRFWLVLYRNRSGNGGQPTFVAVVVNERVHVGRQPTIDPQNLENVSLGCVHVPGPDLCQDLRHGLLCGLRPQRHAVARRLLGFGHLGPTVDPLPKRRRQLNISLGALNFERRFLIQRKQIWFKEALLSKYFHWQWSTKKIF